MGRQRAIRFRGKMPAGRAWLLSSVACAALALGTPQAPAAEPFAAPERFVAPEVPKWHPWAEIGGYWGSDRTSRGEATLWAPLFQRPDSLLFVDARGKLFERSVREGNLALGWRQMTAAGWNWGIWTGVDAHRSRAGNTFWQWSGGLEALAPDWDARVNAYLPFDRRKPVSRTEVVVGNGEPEVVLTNDQILMVSGEDRITTVIDELALHGFDAEAGVRLFGTDPDAPGPRHEFRLYGGGFWFDHRDLPRSLAGPMARAEWRIDDALGLSGSRLTLEAGFSYDRVRKDRWEAGARLRIPLGGARPEPAAYAGLPLTPQERRMAERVERQTAVLTREVVEETVTLERVEEQVADALTEVRFDRVVFVNPSVTDTSADAGPNSLLIADGVTILGPQELEGDQTLQGGGSTIDVRGVETGTILPFTAPGTQPTLANPGNAANLTLLGANTHVAGIAVEGAGQFSGFNNNHGILVGSDRQNMFIGLSDISEVGREGIDIINRNEVTIYRTDIRNTGDDGIDITGDDNVVTITEVNTTDTDDEGIDVNGFRNRVNVSDVTITNAGDHGMEIDSQFNVVDIERLTITNTASQGIDIDDDHEVTIRDLTITNAGINGIRLGGGNTVMIADADISNAGNDGIGVRGDNNRLSVTGTSITNSGDDGIDLDGRNNTVDLDQVTIAGTVQEGIDVGDDNEVTIANSSISNTADFGVRIRGGNTVTIEGSTITNTGLEGIILQGGGNTVSVVDTSISDIGRVGSDASGIDILGSNNTLSLLRTDISNVLEDEGVNISGNFNQVTLTDSTISNMIDGDGVDVDGNNNTVALTRVSITDARDTMDVQGAGNDVTITDSTFVRAQRHGIRIESDNTVRLDGSTIAESGDDAIKIRGNFNTLEITDSEIRNAGDDGIEMDGDGNSVTVAISRFENIRDDGIDSIDGENNTVTVADTLFIDIDDHAITIGSNNTYVITNTTIMNPDNSGILIAGDNDVTLEDSVFTGDFGNNGIRFVGGNNTLDGDGNTAAGATFGGQFCETGGFLQNGFFSFDDDGTGNPATCPPGLAFSDIRLKRDIAELGRLDNGLGLYRFRYLWSDTVHVGVMAQEVQAVAPQAVVRRPDGFLQVDYSRLGLRPMTWDEWAARSRTDQASERPRLPAS